ncbi:MAG: DUF2007 domain-containing protein [Dehalococcoidia bacterium]
MSERRDRARERLVRAAVAENPATADMVRDTLRAAGIPSMLKNVDALSVSWGGQAPPWALEVWVLEGDADLAAALLGGERAPTPLPPPALGPSERPRRRWFRRRR